MVVNALERMGNKVLRLVLPGAEASACYTRHEWYARSIDGGKIALYNVEITCTSQQGCHLYGPSVGVDSTSWNGYC